ncbi:hypothetical protein [Sulfurimonas sp.]|uniref:hypothetical protein n=1 Tax=Sulfurimonas sp. TaxID=2022749 RepID=UPI002AB11D33|nr:hypothetical protein [Sulfurimonas sp.]
MIYKYQNEEIDLSKVKRLYPAALIELDGEMAEMSLEWMEMNEGKVNLIEYILVFDFTPPKEEVKDKKVLHFDIKEKLMKEMQEVAKLFA